MVLNHVTPARNLASILRSGLKVAGSHKGRPVVWLCDRRHLLWTLGHVARWKQRDPASMRIVSVECEPGAGMSSSACRSPRPRSASGTRSVWSASRVTASASPRAALWVAQMGDFSDALSARDATSNSA